MKRIFWVVFSILLTFLTCEIIARAFLWMPPLEINVGTPRQGLTVDAIGDWSPISVRFGKMDASSTRTLLI